MLPPQVMAPPHLGFGAASTLAAGVRANQALCQVGSKGFQPRIFFCGLGSTITKLTENK